MTPIDDEEDRLRTVALQNAQSILAVRQRAEETLRKQSEWMRVTLASIGDGVISTDAEGRVTFLNGVAETLTGWPQAEAVGRPLPEVFHIVNEHTRQPVENPALRALREGTIVGLANHTVLIARDGTERPIDDSAGPMQGDSNAPIGAVLVFRDVTERKQAEEALRRKEAELTDFIENAAVGLHWLGADGTILWANKAELDFLGYSREEYVGHNIVEFHVDRPVIDDILSRLLNKQELRGTEAKLRCKDGSVKYVLINSNGLWDGDRFVHTRCFTHDVTDRMRAEESQARLAAIVESSDDAIVSKTLDGVVRSWNAGAVRLFGYTAEEAVGQPITLIIPPERIDEEAAILERLRRGERVEHFETIRVAKDGHRLDVSLTISPVRDGGGRVIGASKVARDVSERKRAESALREKERLIRQVAEASLTIHSSGSLDSVLSVIAEESRRILGAHRAVSTLTVGESWAQGINVVSTSESYWRWRDHTIPPPVEGACAEVCRTNRPIRLTRAELEAHPAWRNLSGKRDEYPPLLGWLGAPLVSRDGKNLGLIRVSDKECGDFSESDEAALVQLSHVASVAIENSRLYGELREQDRRKEEFIALLAHELRNPLAPLRNGLQVMRLGNAAAVAQARDMMERQLGHVVRLIDDLLDISRINQNKMEILRSRVLLGDVVSSAVETARPAIESAGHEFTVTLPPEPVYLDADLTRLGQVFSNLLTNSAKYTDRGGRIWLTAERKGVWVTVTVRDTGIGIPADALPRIFDMFSQVDRSIERATGGLGIGLALVKGLVGMHGGTVTAASEGQGKGSTFTVTLPVLAGQPESGVVRPEEGQAAAGSMRRVLVVDDNQDGADSLALMLSLLGDEVRTANDGLEAIELAEAFRPQVILMDVGMPRLNGLDATRRIRERDWAKAVTIVALTGWGQDNDRARSREAGCDGHLVKPVNLRDLQKLLGDLRGT